MTNGELKTELVTGDLYGKITLVYGYIDLLYTAPKEYREKVIELDLSAEKLDDDEKETIDLSLRTLVLLKNYYREMNSSISDYATRSAIVVNISALAMLTSHSAVEYLNAHIDSHPLISATLIGKYENAVKIW